MYYPQRILPDSHRDVKVDIEVIDEQLIREPKIV